jgi:hypothetical protein
MTIYAKYNSDLASAFGEEDFQSFLYSLYKET